MRTFNRIQYLKILLIIILLNFIENATIAQSLIPYFKPYKRAFSYVDYNTMALKFDKEFGWADFFSDGVARVSNEFSRNYANSYNDYYPTGVKFGIINESGKLIADYKYDYISRFKYGVAIFSLNNKFGLINSLGEEIVDAKYDEISDLNDSIALVKLNNLLGYINISGNLITPIIYKYATAFNEGVASVSTGDLFGIIDKTGKTIIPYKYKYPVYFNSGLAAVNGAYINKKGEIVINLKSISEFSFYKGVCWMEIPRKGYALINTKGEYIRQPSMDIKSVSKFINDICKIEYNSGKIEIINPKGESLAFLDFSKHFNLPSVSDFTGGRAILTDPDKLNSYIINKSGVIELVLPIFLSYPEITDIGFFRSGVYTIDSNGKIFGDFDFSGFVSNSKDSSDVHHLFEKITQYIINNKEDSILISNLAIGDFAEIINNGINDQKVREYLNHIFTLSTNLDFSISKFQAHIFWNSKNDNLTRYCLKIKKEKDFWVVFDLDEKRISAEK